MDFLLLALLVFFAWKMDFLLLPALVVFFGWKMDALLPALLVLLVMFLPAFLKGDSISKDGGGKVDYADCEFGGEVEYCDLEGGSIPKDRGGKVDYVDCEFGGEVEYCEGANCGDGLDYDSDLGCSFGP